MNILEKFKNISTFVFDVDGVLTDGTILVLNDGQLARQMNVKDGFGLQLAVKKGYRVLIVSGGTSEAIIDRFNKLGISEVHMGIIDKTKLVANYLQTHKLKWEEVLVMGDDLPDFELLKEAGLSCCPADAVQEIRSMVTYISSKNGGDGCVREVIEKVLRANEHWHFDIEITFR